MTADSGALAQMVRDALGEVGPDLVELAEVVVCEAPLTVPVHTARAEFSTRRSVLVHLTSNGADGWGECGAVDLPGYPVPTTAEAAAALVAEVLPAWLAGRARPGPSDHPGAPDPLEMVCAAALEMALLDLALRRDGSSFAALAGVGAGTTQFAVTLGRMDPKGLHDAAGEAVGTGATRLKCKVAAGDAPGLAALTAAFPGIQVTADANGSLADLEEVLAFDGAGLAFLEQPVADPGPVDLGVLRTRLATPVALDESLGSPAAARAAWDAGHMDVAVLKPPRLGGLAAAAETAGWLAERGCLVVIGGLFDLGIARHANAVFSAVCGSHPGEVGPTDAYLADDVCGPAPVVADPGDGQSRTGVRLWDGPGLCPPPDLGGSGITVITRTPVDRSA